MSPRVVVIAEIVANLLSVGRINVDRKRLEGGFSTSRRSASNHCTRLTSAELTFARRADVDQRGADFAAAFFNSFNPRSARRAASKISSIVRVGGLVTFAHRIDDRLDDRERLLVLAASIMANTKHSSSKDEGTSSSTPFVAGTLAMLFREVLNRLLAVVLHLLALRSFSLFCCSKRSRMKSHRRPYPPLSRLLGTRLDGLIDPRALGVFGVDEADPASDMRALSASAVPG